MQKSALIALLVLGCLGLWADEPVKLDVKLGLWETTNTFQTSGMPPVNIPPDALAKMTPEQRAKVEEMMKGLGSGTPRTTTTKSCLTREKMSKHEMFNEDRKDCTHTIVNSSSSRLEMRVQCATERAKTNGTIRIEALSSENVKGSMQMAVTNSDRTMNMNSNFTSKWLGSDCGDVK